MATIHQGCRQTD